MKCNVCDQVLRKDWRFCPECGYDVNVKKKPAEQRSFEPPESKYGEGVRSQVFEVIVRQAMAGAPWREICAGPMEVNQISPTQVELEVRRRLDQINDNPKKADGKNSKSASKFDSKPGPVPAAKQKGASAALPPVSSDEPRRLEVVRALLEKLRADKTVHDRFPVVDIDNALDELDETVQIISEQEELLNEVEREAELQRDIDRERGAEYDF